MTPNIPLTRSPRPEDFDDVTVYAQKECHCTSEMKSQENLSKADEVLCKTCAARQLLNGVTTLADEIRD